MRNPFHFILGFLLVWSIFGWWFFTTCDCTTEITTQQEVAIESIAKVDLVEEIDQTSSLLPAASQLQEAPDSESKDQLAKIAPLTQAVSLTGAEELEVLAINSDFRMTLQYDKVDDAVNLSAKSTKIIENILFANPNSTLFVEGHYHSTSEPDKDFESALKRANNIKAFLIARGIFRNQVKALSKGSTVPIASNGYHEGRSINRRVNLWIKKTK